MSEYHSFSLVEHLPVSKPGAKKALADQQQFNFEIHTPSQFSTNKNDILHSINDNSTAIVDHNNNHHDDWSNPNTTNSFHGFDSLLNNMSNHNRNQDTAPVNSNEYQNLFEFLPFDQHDASLLVNNNKSSSPPTSSSSVSNNIHAVTAFHNV